MSEEERVKGEGGREGGGLEGWIQAPLAQRVSRREEIRLGRELTSTSLRSSRTLTPYHNTICLPGSTGNPPPFFVSPFSLSVSPSFLIFSFFFSPTCTFSSFDSNRKKIELCVHSCVCAYLLPVCTFVSTVVWCACACACACAWGLHT